MQSILDFFHELFLALEQGQIPELGWWSYLLLSILVLLEGPMATLIGAAAAAAGLMRVQMVFIVAAGSNLVADVLWYSIGSSGKMEWVRRRINASERQMADVEKGVNDNAVKMLLLAKMSIGLAVPTLITVGLARVPWRRWLPAVFVGEVLFTGILVVIGYYAAELIAQVERGLYYLGIVITVVLLSTVAIFIWRYFRKTSDAEETQEVTP
jgi:membrane protein DedA with SNARE-associated domain